MPPNRILTYGKALKVQQFIIASGKIEKPEITRLSDIKDCSELLDDMDKLEAMKYHHQLQDSVVRNALQQHIEVARFQLVQGFGCLKKAIVKLKALASHTEQATNVKPRHRGFYVFLYGARVNPDTFYDYKDNLRRGRL